MDAQLLELNLSPVMMNLYLVLATLGLTFLIAQGYFRSSTVVSTKGRDELSSRDAFSPPFDSGRGGTHIEILPSSPPPEGSTPSISPTPAPAPIEEEWVEDENFLTHYPWEEAFAEETEDLALV